MTQLILVAGSSGGFGEMSAYALASVYHCMGIEKLLFI